MREVSRQVPTAVHASADEHETESISPDSVAFGNRAIVHTVPAACAPSALAPIMPVASAAAAITRHARVRQFAELSPDSLRLSGLM